VFLVLLVPSASSLFLLLPPHKPNPSLHSSPSLPSGSMTQTRKPTKPNPQPRQAQNPSFSTTGMKLIVPLQGVVQGRGGLLLGTLVPCALFYFLQLYLKRRRSNFSPPSPPSEPHLPRTSSRSNLSTRGSISRVRLSKLATQISRPEDSLYYVGCERVSRDPYHAVHNPNGIIQLGLTDNKVGQSSYTLSDMFSLVDWDFKHYGCS